MSLNTLNDLFFHILDHGHPECLLDPSSGEYVPVSAAELGERVMRLEAALERFGVEPGERVALMADNGVHWPVVDFAVLTHGAVLVPVYPTLTAEQAAYIINDCGARLVFVEGSERLNGLLQIGAQMPTVSQWVWIESGEEGSPPPAHPPAGMTGEGSPPAGMTGASSLDTDVPSLGEFSADDYDADAFRRRAEAVGPDDLATFIYTSGTTGNPKGVMLSHGNLASNIVAGKECLDLYGDKTALSFLPLSHSFERTVDYIYFYAGFSVAYAESVQTISSDLQRVNPHVFVSVPRVYEKVLAKVQEAVTTAGGLKQKLFDWAVEVGRESVPWRLRLEKPPGLLGLKLALADRLVFAKIRARLGNRFEKAVSGGAPLGQTTAEFFWGAGIEIYEGYGLSETSPALCFNRRGKARIGSVGPPLPGVEIRIAEDGEILARGPNIMQGYFNLPEETAEAFTEDGWFRTGDIGRLDEDGYLWITDRKKEILVNAYGKNVAPAPIENALKASPLIEHAVVIGDRRKFLAALLIPDADNLAAWARRNGLDGAEIDSLVASDRLRQQIADHVQGVNADLSRYQQIRKWELVPATFSIDGGELTPTQKVKRRVINDKYAEEIESLYAAGDEHGEPA